MKESIVINSKGESNKKRLLDARFWSGNNPRKEAYLIAADKLAKSMGINLSRKNKPTMTNSSHTTLASAAIGRTMVSTAPRTSKSKGGSVTVCHRELIEGSILGTTTFGVAASYILQPGDKKSFPWLSIQAAQYEQYRFRRLRFSYVPIVGTSTAGDVMLLADYNVQDPAPILEVDALDHPRAQSGSLWEPHTFACDISQMHGLGPRKFVRTTAVAGDPKTYDCGNFHLCINNSSVTTAVGKLFVEYEVEFFVPQLNPQNVLALKPSQVTLLDYASAQLLTDNANFPLAVANSRGFDPLRIYPLASPSTTTVLTPPAGCYRVKATVFFTCTISESVIYQLFLQKNGTTIPSVAASPSFIGSVTYLEMTNEQIMSFSGLDNLSIVAKFDGLTTACSVPYVQVFFTLA